MYCYMLSDYLKEIYGNKIYKLMLSSDMTCPNRDGKCGYYGCIFCSDNGAGEFAQDARLSIAQQIEKAKKQVPSNYDRYIAYFQSFTNTYASLYKLKKLYRPVINRDDIAILSIATRPDCLSDEVIDFLSELNQIKPVWIELGLQTIHDNTAEFIRRGYPLSVYIDAVNGLKKVGVKVITHLILGLPNESKADMIESARFVGKHSDGIKFHNLYITENADIAAMYKDNKISLLTKEEYIDTLCECIRVIPKNVVIHRLTGDPDKSTLLAPMWCKDKISLLRDIKNAFYDRDVNQGEKLNKD